MTVQIHGREVFNDSDINTPNIDGGTIDNTTIGTTTPAASVFTQSSWSKGSDVASANALTLGSDGNYFDITGVTAITSIATIGIGTVVILHFDGILTLTHNAADLILPGAANITTAAGDEATFVEYATGDWRCTSYTKESGIAVKTEISEDTTPELGGDLAAVDKEISRPKIKDYAETVNAIGDLGGGTDDINLESGNVVTATVSTAAETFTFSSPPANGIAGSFTLILTNGGSQTVNWPASVKWGAGTAPSLTASGIDVLTFVTTDAGTNWFGFAAGIAMA